MGHQGAGGENPLQLLGCGHQCGGATYHPMNLTRYHNLPHLNLESRILSWYDLPSPSPPTSSHLRPHPPPHCLFCLHSAPTPMHTCATCTTTSHPLSD